MLIQLFSKIKSRFGTPSYIFGRWANDETFSKKKLKIDYANEDHCFCDDYLQNKLKEQNKKKNNTPRHQLHTFTSKRDFVMWKIHNNKINI